MNDNQSDPRENYTFAFQPIVDIDKREVWAYEALVRGPNGETAQAVLDQFSGDDLLRFDREARVRALELASRLGYTGRLSMNMMNKTLDLADEVLADTVASAIGLGYTSEQVMLEVSEKDQVPDVEDFLRIVRPARSLGAGFALDDFGAGYSGLNLLAEFQPNFIKLDIVLVRDIWNNGPRQAIIRGVMKTCLDLGIEVIAEGVEAYDDFEWLWNAGARLFQGYLFARPEFEAFPVPEFPASPDT